MQREAPDEDVIALDLDDEDDDLEPDLGPDERDMDLLDGSWEQRYYSGQVRTRDWGAITIGLALLALIGMTLPMVFYFL